jgi:hypothetical protein
MNQDTMKQYLRSRRISQTIGDIYHIRAGEYGARPALLYPVLVGGRAHARGRVKFTDGRQPKYAWSGPTSTKPPEYYNADGFDAPGDVLVLASGEVDLWTLRQAGYAAVVSWFGEANVPPDLVERIRASGKTRVVTFTDRDATGDRMAQKVAAACADAGVAYTAYALPGTPGSGFDVNAYWRAFSGDETAFRAALEALPGLDLPLLAHAPERAPAISVPARNDNDADELEAVRAQVCAAIHAALKPRRGRQRRGYYECPLPHGKDGKDFLFDPATGAVGGCQGKHAGMLTRWRDLAEHLGIDVTAIARRVAEDRRPHRAATTSRASVTHTVNPASASTTFPRGFPQHLFELLLHAHKDAWLADVPDLAAAALTWYVHHELRCDAEFVLADLYRTGRITPETATAGARQLVALGVWQLADGARDFSVSCNQSLNDLYEDGADGADAAAGSLLSTDRKKTRCMKRKNGTVCTPRGRPSVRLRARSTDVAVEALLAFFEARIRQRSLTTTDGRVLADGAATYIRDLADAGMWVGDVEAAAQAADAARREALDGDRDARAKALAEAARRSALFRRKYSYANLARGPVVRLPDGCLSPRTIRRLLWAIDLDARGGRRTGGETRAIQLRVGVSRSQAARYRRREGVLAVPQYRDVALRPGDGVRDQVGSRAHVVELCASDGAVFKPSVADFGDVFVADCAARGVSVTARVRAASCEVRAAAASADEVQASQRDGASQAARAAQRTGIAAARRGGAEALNTRYSASFHVRQASLGLAHRFSVRGGRLLNARTGELYDLTTENVWRACAGLLDVVVVGQHVEIEPTAVSQPQDEPTPATNQNAAPTAALRVYRAASKFPYRLTRTVEENAAERALFARIDAEEQARREYALQWAATAGVAMSVPSR